MAGLRFTMAVHGDVQVDRRLEAVEVHAGQIDTVLHAIAADLRKSVAQQFVTEGGWGSGGWRRLTDNYRRQKQSMVDRGKWINGRQARHMQILRLTDRLRRSLIHKTDPEHIETVRNHTLEFGTRVPYGAVHQRPLRGQTRRRFLDLPESKRQQYVRAILSYVRTGDHGL